MFLLRNVIRRDEQINDDVSSDCVMVDCSLLRCMTLALLCAVLWGGAMCPVSAQSNADINYQRSQERGREIRKQQEKPRDVNLQNQSDETESLTIPENESPCFAIHHIQLQGHQSEHFQFALSPVMDQKNPILGRCLGQNGINVVMKRIQNAIIDKGYVTTRVVAEEQDLTSGNLVLTIIPGHVRSVRFSEDSNKRRATKWNAVPIHQGDLLNLRDMEQALENFKRVPTADVDIQIVPSEEDGAQDGDSDLVIDYQQNKPYRISASVDDSGMKATGKYQGNVTLSLDNLLTLNDLFYASYTHNLKNAYGKSGTNDLTVHYSIPLGYWNVGATFDKSRYRQVVPFLQNMDNTYTGETENAELKVSRLIYRDAVRKTTIGVKVFYRSARNFILDQEINLQRNKSAGWGIDVVHREYIGSSVLDLSVAYKRGTGAMGALPAAEGTSRFGILTADSTWNIPFGIPMPWGRQDMSYQFQVSGQWSKEQLASPERYSIGGRYTVRGFDGEMILMADRGYLVRNELSVTLGNSNHAVYAGVDYGAVSGPSAQYLAGNSLAGGVVGIRGGYKGLNYDVFVGAPIDKPKELITPTVTTGFNLNWSY